MNEETRMILEKLEQICEEVENLKQTLQRENDEQFKLLGNYYFNLNHRMDSIDSVCEANYQLRLEVLDLSTAMREVKEKIGLMYQ